MAKAKVKTEAGRKKVARVMREFHAGTLRSSSGEKVTDVNQARAIAMSEGRRADKAHKAQEGVLVAAKEGATVTIEKKGKKPIEFEKGGLHRSLGVPEDQPIPKAKLRAALEGKHGPKARKQAVLAAGALKAGRKTAAKRQARGAQEGAVVWPPDAVVQTYMRSLFASAGDPLYEPSLDLNQDGIIDFLDMNQFFTDWFESQTYPPVPQVAAAQVPGAPTTEPTWGGPHPTPPTATVPTVPTPDRPVPPTLQPKTGWQYPGPRPPMPPAVQPAQAVASEVAAQVGAPAPTGAALIRQGLDELRTMGQYPPRMRLFPSVPSVAPTTAPTRTP